MPVQARRRLRIPRIRAIDGAERFEAADLIYAPEIEQFYPKGFATKLFAPSWRQVFDVGNWEKGCSGVLYPGQSGHRASRHHHDLSKRWLLNRQFPLTWGDAAFAGRRTLRLVPGERGLIATQPRL